MRTRLQVALVKESMLLCTMATLIKIVGFGMFGGVAGALFQAYAPSQLVPMAFTNAFIIGIASALLVGHFVVGQKNTFYRDCSAGLRVIEWLPRQVDPRGSLLFVLIAAYTTVYSIVADPFSRSVEIFATFYLAALATGSWVYIVAALTDNQSTVFVVVIHCHPGDPIFGHAAYHLRAA